MADELVAAGTANKIVEVFLRDSATGQGKTGIVFGGIVVKYHRQGDAAAITVAASAGVAGTWSSGGWIAVTNGATGFYQFGVPNAALVAGANKVTITITGAGFIDKTYTIDLKVFEDATARNAAIGAAAEAAVAALHGTGPYDGTDAGGPSGPLTDPMTLTYEKAVGVPLPDLHVWVSTDVTGNFVVDAGVTKDDGTVRLLLDDGSPYFRWARIAGRMHEEAVPFTAVKD